MRYGDKVRILLYTLDLYPINVVLDCRKPSIVLDAIIRKANALSTPARPHAKEAELSDDEEDNNHLAMKDAEKDRSGAFVDIVLAAAKKLVQR